MNRAGFFCRRRGDSKPASVGTQLRRALIGWPERPAAPDFQGGFAWARTVSLGLVPLLDDEVRYVPGPRGTLQVRAEPSVRERAQCREPAPGTGHPRIRSLWIRIPRGIPRDGELRRCVGGDGKADPDPRGREEPRSRSGHRGRRRRGGRPWLLRWNWDLRRRSRLRGARTTRWRQHGDRDDCEERNNECERTEDRLQRKRNSIEVRSEAEASATTGRRIALGRETAGAI